MLPLAVMSLASSRSSPSSPSQALQVKPWHHLPEAGTHGQSGTCEHISYFVRETNGVAHLRLHLTTPITLCSFLRPWPAIGHFSEATQPGLARVWESHLQSRRSRS